MVNILCALVPVFHANYKVQLARKQALIHVEVVGGCDKDRKGGLCADMCAPVAAAEGGWSMRGKPDEFNKY